MSAADHDVALAATVTCSPVAFADEAACVLAVAQAEPSGSFTPKYSALSETVEATYGGEGLPDKTISEDVPDATDIVLWGLFHGMSNMFPIPPNPKNWGVPGQALAAPAQALAFPAILHCPGVVVTAGFLIEESVLERAPLSEADLAAGYDSTPISVKVRICMALRGPTTEAAS